MDDLLDPQNYSWHDTSACIEVIDGRTPPIAKFGVIFRSGSQEVVLISSAPFNSYWLEGTGPMDAFIFRSCAHADLARQSFPEESWTCPCRSR